MYGELIGFDNAHVLSRPFCFLFSLLLCSVTVGGCGGPGMNPVYRKSIKFSGVCVPSRPFPSLIGLESIDFTVIVWFFIWHGLESTVKMGIFILQLTR